MWLLNILPDWVFHLIVIVSIIGLLVLPLVSFMPVVKTHKTLVNYILIGLLSFGVFMEGAISNNNKWKQEVAELKLENAKLETKAAEKTVEIVTKVVTKVEKIKGDTVEIIRNVPVYITKENDANCAIPNSFVQLHNFAAENKVPDPAGIPDAGTSDIKLSEVSETVFGNYGTCHEIREKYIGLQNWVKEQEKLQNESSD